MRPGIYLGPPVGRARRLVWLLVALASLGTSFHVSLYIRERGELDAVRARVERQDVRGRASSQETGDALGDEARDVLARLRAASASGVASTMSSAQILHLLSRALPDQVALVGVSFEPSSTPPSLLLEAVARREGDVTALQKAVADSPRVAATKLLGERTSAAGTLSVRLQVELAMERSP
jgi:hypothetical protein